MAATITDETRRIKSDTNWDGTFVLEKNAASKANRQKQMSSDSRNFFAPETTTTITTTYYDSRGNVISVDKKISTDARGHSKNAKGRTHCDAASVCESDVTERTDGSSTLTDAGSTSRMRDEQRDTNSRDFYAHDIDPSATMVKNVYDSTAVQNTIGTRGRVVTHNLVDSTDLVYSNDRNYGKTGWNGKFA